MLASASPRREMLLRQIGLVFDVRPTDVEAGFVSSGKAPETDALKVAEAKARAAAAAGGDDALVLGADTVVLTDGVVLGKPAGPADAEVMLARLSGREHTVLTAVAILDCGTGAVFRGVERTKVKFSPMSPEEIRCYVQTGEPLDKAGAYAVQGLGSLFVERVEGCYSNVVGLPLALVGRMLRAAGLEVVDAWQTAATGCAGGEGDDRRPEDQGPSG